MTNVLLSVSDKDFLSNVSSDMLMECGGMTHFKTSPEVHMLHCSLQTG